MRNGKATVLIAMLICVVTVPVCSARSRRGKAKPVRMSALEILDKYAETQDKLKSFILRYEDQYQADNKMSFIPGREKRRLGKSGYIGELRSDGTRHYFRQKLWEESRQHLPTNKASAESDPRFLSTLWDGEHRYQYLRSNAQATNDKLFLSPKGHESARGDDIITTSWSRGLLGFFEDTYKLAPYGYKRVDSELRNANRISVRSKMENVGGLKCYVIEARKKYSTYKLWIDPEHGYHISKAEINRGGSGIEWGKSEEVSLFTYLRNVRFKQVNNVWMPVEADYGFDRKLIKSGFEKEDHHHKITKFTLDPDHDAMRSFMPDEIRNGTKVLVIGTKGSSKTWRDGQVVDENGGVVFDSKSRKDSGDKRLIARSIIMGRYIIIAIVCLMPLQVTAKELPSAQELRGRCGVSLDRLRSLIVKGELQMDMRRSLALTGPARPGAIGTGKMYKRFEVRSDGRRIAQRSYYWGNVKSLKHAIPAEKPAYLSNLWDGTYYMRYSRGSNGQERVLLDGKQSDYEVQRLQQGHVGAFGVSAGTTRRLDKIMQEAKNVLVQTRERPEKPSPLCVLTADTIHGRYTVHFDPHHGYLPAYVKVQLKAGQGHKFYGRSFDEAGVELTWERWNLKFKKIHDFWVPVETEQRYHRFYKRDKFEDNKTHTRFNYITLNPDHGALNSFYPDDVRHGTPVFLRNVRLKTKSNTFIWQNGKVVDKDGREVDTDKLIKAESNQVKRRESRRR